MRRLVCACVVRKPPKTGFLATRPISLSSHHVMNWYQYVTFGKTVNFDNFWGVRFVPKFHILYFNVRKTGTIFSELNFHIAECEDTLKMSLMLFVLKYVVSVK